MRIRFIGLLVVLGAAVGLSLAFAQDSKTQKQEQPPRGPSIKVWDCRPQTAKACKKKNPRCKSISPGTLWMPRPIPIATSRTIIIL